MLEKYLDRILSPHRPSCMRGNEDGKDRSQDNFISHTLTI